MKIDYHKDFLKNFRRRIQPNPNLVERFKERKRLFLTDPQNPILKDHKLTGRKKNFRAFSITGDISVVYKIETNIIRLYDVGNHNQVY